LGFRQTSGQFLCQQKYRESYRAPAKPVQMVRIAWIKVLRPERTYKKS